jgi:hypothetical protein
MEYYSALTRTELPSEKIQRKFKCTSLNERRQCENAAHCIIASLGHSAKAKLWRHKISGCQSIDERKKGMNMQIKQFSG